MTFHTVTDPTSWAIDRRLPFPISYRAIGDIYTQFVCVIHSMQSVFTFQRPQIVFGHLKGVHIIAINKNNQTKWHLQTNDALVTFLSNSSDCSSTSPNLENVQFKSTHL